MLEEAARARLKDLLENPEALPRLNSEQRETLSDWLLQTRVAKRNADLEGRVGLYDRVTLVSPQDSRDWYKLEIVMPLEADVDEDRISVLAPVSLAVLGRKDGDRVSWVTPSGPRTMTIIAIQKGAYH